MSILNTRTALVLILTLFVIGIFFRFTSLIHFPDSQTILEKGDTQKLLVTQSLKQTFLPNRAGLSGIEFLMRTPGPNTDDVVEITIADDTCSQPLRNSMLQPSFLNSNNLYAAYFPPIEDSQDKRYCAVISYQAAESDTRYLRFFTIENTDSATSLSLPKGNVAKNQSLSLRLVYNNDSFWGDLKELNQRMSQYKPWFLKGLFITVIGGLFLVLSIGLLIALIFMPESTKEASTLRDAPIQSEQER